MATSTSSMAIYPKLRTLRRWFCLGYQVEKMSRSEGVEWRVSGRQEEVSRGVPGFKKGEMGSV
jgi:hypothetical protein